MSDQRQIRRHPASILRVSFEHPTSGERADAIAWDASLGGMFIETASPLDEGALVALEITTADAKVSADARVLWRRATGDGEHQPAGMAVRFIDLPDDVSVALNRALQSGMAEKTILGIGGATQEPTQPGIMPDPALVKPGRVPRETQIGVAPPANAPAKPRLVISETSLPETPAAPAVAPEPKARAQEDSPTAKGHRPSAPSSEPPPPPGSGGLFGRILLLLALGGAAGAAYLHRDRIAEMLAGPAPVPTAAPTTAPDDGSTPAIAEPEDAAPSADAANAEVEVEDAASGSAALLDGAAADASASGDAGHVVDAGHTDAGARDAGARDAGARDAGRDSGARGTARPDAGRAPKHP